MMLFLGATLVAIAATLHVLSLGISTPSTFAGVVGGSALFLAGAGLFAYNKSTLTEEMRTFEKGATDLLEDTRIKHSKL